MVTTQEQGAQAETLACQYLEKQGLKLLDRNYHCRFGELDLVMQHNDHLVIIEVRYRRNTDFGSGAESITANKQSKLIKTASLYLQRHAKLAKYPVRFDVISMSGKLNNIDINWIENAFAA